jgi:hypothetical protein
LAKNVAQNQSAWGYLPKNFIVARLAADWHSQKRPKMDLTAVEGKVKKF